MLLLRCSIVFIDLELGHFEHRFLIVDFHLIFIVMIIKTYLWKMDNEELVYKDIFSKPNNGRR